MSLYVSLSFFLCLSLFFLSLYVSLSRNLSVQSLYFVLFLSLCLCLSLSPALSRPVSQSLSLSLSRYPSRMHTHTSKGRQNCVAEYTNLCEHEFLFSINVPKWDTLACIHHGMSLNVNIYMYVTHVNAYVRVNICVYIRIHIYIYILIYKHRHALDRVCMMSCPSGVFGVSPRVQSAFVLASSVCLIQ